MCKYQCDFPARASAGQGKRLLYRREDVSACHCLSEHPSQSNRLLGTQHHPQGLEDLPHTGVPISSGTWLWERGRDRTTSFYISYFNMAFKNYKLLLFFFIKINICQPLIV